MDNEQTIAETLVERRLREEIDKQLTMLLLRDRIYKWCDQNNIVLVNPRKALKFDK